MSYSQFLAIHRAFHFDLDFIVNKANENAKKHWTPFQQVTVDEWIMPLKGRSKPHSSDIKVFCIVDNAEYKYHFWVYRDKDNLSNASSTKHDFVWNLEQKMPMDRKYVVFADRYFGSLDLARTLHEHGHQFELSCQANHPSELFSEYLHRLLKRQNDVQHIVTEDGKICALSYYDGCSSSARSVDTCANGHTAPCIVNMYQDYMHAMDKADAAINQYLCFQRTAKYTRAVFYGVFKMLLVNAWRCRQRLSGNLIIEQQDFLLSIIDSLTKRTARQRRRRRSHLLVDSGDDHTFSSEQQMQQ